jgi:phi LC3 family holin
MKLNWKLRIKNKVTLTAIIAGVLSLIYTVLGFFGIVPSVTESMMMDTAYIIIDLLVLVGIVVDPTTPGTDDSDRALSYEDLGGEIDG